MEWLPANALTILAGGSLIGFLLGLLGGGGSLLAVPLLLHVGGLASAHVAIGTSAVAVALNAYINALGFARRGEVMWRTALLFAGAGIVTAVVGALLGLQTPSRWLMVAFGGLTLGVALWMWRNQNRAAALPATPDTAAAVHAITTRKTVLAGLGVGSLAGFFGIGGGFMVVPALLWATGGAAGINIRKVMGTSLVGVGTLGLSTAATYALAGHVNWPVATLLLLGGMVGGQLGQRVGAYVHGRNKHLLQQMFAIFIGLIGVWLIYSHGWRGH